MAATEAAVAPASALAKDAEAGLLEWRWPSSVTSRKPSAATASRTVWSPVLAWIATWPVDPSKDKVTGPMVDEAAPVVANNAGERPADSPIAARVRRENGTPPPSHGAPPP